LQYNSSPFFPHVSYTVLSSSYMTVLRRPLPLYRRSPPLHWMFQSLLFPWRWRLTSHQLRYCGRATGSPLSWNIQRVIPLSWGLSFTIQLLRPAAWHCRGDSCCQGYFVKLLALTFFNFLVTVWSFVKAGITLFYLLGLKFFQRRTRMRRRRKRERTPIPLWQPRPIKFHPGLNMDLINELSISSSGELSYYDKRQLINLFPDTMKVLIFCERATTISIIMVLRHFSTKKFLTFEPGINVFCLCTFFPSADLVLQRWVSYPTRHFGPL